MDFIDALKAGKWFAWTLFLAGLLFAVGIIIDGLKKNGNPVTAILNENRKKP